MRKKGLYYWRIWKVIMNYLSLYRLRREMFSRDYALYVNELNDKWKSSLDCVLELCMDEIVIVHCLTRSSMFHHDIALHFILNFSNFSWIDMVFQHLYGYG